MSLSKEVFEDDKKDAGTLPAPQKRQQYSEDLLYQKAEFLVRAINEQIATALICGTTSKRAALQALKRKRVHEKHLALIESVLFYESWRKMSENDGINKEAHNFINDESTPMDLQKILWADFRSKETHPEDEDELETELEELLQEDLNKKLLLTQESAKGGNMWKLYLFFLIHTQTFAWLTECTWKTYLFIVFILIFTVFTFIACFGIIKLIF